MYSDAIKDWTLEGGLHLWHYPIPVRNLEGWHLNADTSACQSIAALIDRMLDAPSDTKKRIPVSVPTRMRVGQPNVWESSAGLLLIHPKEAIEDTFWKLEYQKDKVVALTLGAEKMRKVRDSLLGLPKWNDDFALGPEVDMRRKADRNLWNKQCLWFWTKVE